MTRSTQNSNSDLLRTNTWSTLDTKQRQMILARPAIAESGLLATASR